jgi:hypothetical protein
LERDGYREYWDDASLERLGLTRLRDDLAAFWPSGGPHWDALAKIELADCPGILLVEAKSYPGEVFSQGLQATAEASRAKIDLALRETKRWLGVAEDVDWTGRLYQAANRLAHLFFFRVRALVPAWIVNVYFTDDQVPERCTTEAEWVMAVGQHKRELGIDRLVIPGMGDVFLSSRSRGELK